MSDWAEYVGTCMVILEDYEQLTVSLKNQLQLCKPQVYLLGYLLQLSDEYSSENINLNDLVTHYQLAVQEVGTELYSLSQQLNEGSEVEDLERKVSDALEKTKPRIEEVYTFASKLAEINKASFSNSIVSRFFDCIPENLKVPHNCKAELIVPLKRNIYVVKKGQQFFRNFLGFAATLAVGTGHVKNVLIYVQYLADYAMSLWQINETDKIGGAETHLSDLQLKIQPIKREVALSCIQLLRTWSKIRTHRVSTHEQTQLFVGLLDLLLDDMMELPNYEIISMTPVQDKIITVQEDLAFLSILVPELEHPFKKLREKKKHLLKQIQDAASNAASVVCELLINEMEENAIRRMDVALSDFLKSIMTVKAHVIEAYQSRRPKSSASHIPNTDGLGSVSSLVNDLEKQLNQYNLSSTYIEHLTEPVKEVLVTLGTFLADVAELRKEHEKLKDLGGRILEAAYKIEYVIKLFRNDLPYCLLLLPDIIEEIKPIKIEVDEIYAKKMYDIGVDTSSVEDIVVGFEDEAQRVIEQLIGGSQQLDVVSIVGMAGRGKTTLAKKVYNHPSIREHFYVFAECCVSQTYQKRDMLLQILGDATEITKEMQIMNEEDLSALLWKCLKGQKYLMILDDLWDIEAWNDLRRCFPDDRNQSRIIITTRLQEVASKVKSRSKILFLRPFSDDESWELLQEKLFQKKRCPEKLLNIGIKIAKSCKGLPLAVVLVAGFLGGMEKTEDKWEQIAKSLSSYVIGDGDKQCMGILEMSFKHLPNHLKPCLLYFGAFPEDREIPVQILIHLWIAEGFIIENELRSLEDEAEFYLMDLISRSLVIDARKKAKGGVKACRVHDILREFCLAKAKEETFLQVIQGYDELFSSQLLNGDLPRLCIYSTRKDFAAWRPPRSQLQALLLFAPILNRVSTSFYDVSCIAQCFEFLRVLDLRGMTIDHSFCGLELLVHLRYLAVQLGINHIEPSIAKLHNLQTFLVKGRRGEVELPNTIWKMSTLRHMHIHERVSFTLDRNNLEDTQLDNLITLSTPALSNGEDSERILKRFPALRKLKCIFLESWDSHKKCNQFPVLGTFLSELESLNVVYHGKVLYPCVFSFPSKLTKLTLSKFRLPWSELSTIAEQLPNLEVLKLLFKAFEGDTWETREGQFPNLKFLKLDSLDIVQWDTDRDHFPSLQQLVLQRCKQLQEIPSCVGDIDTLHTIEVQWCSPSAANSAREILEEQKEYGNEELKVLIYPPELQVQSSS